MRRIVTASIMVIATSALPCSWKPGTPSPIARNVATSRDYLFIALLILVASATGAFRTKRHYWVPVALALLAGETWLQIQDAYGGDCGHSAVKWATLSIPMSLIGLGWQSLASYRDARLKTG